MMKWDILYHTLTYLINTECLMPSISCTYFKYKSFMDYSTVWQGMMMSKYTILWLPRENFPDFQWIGEINFLQFVNKLSTDIVLPNRGSNREMKKLRQLNVKSINTLVVKFCKLQTSNEHKFFMKISTPHKNLPCTLFLLMGKLLV